MRPQDPKLARLLSEKFVPVRLVSLKGVDLSRFRFDYDQTFMVIGQTPEGRTLFRWNSRDDDPKALSDLAALLERPWPATGKPASPLAPPRTLISDTQFARTKRAAEPCYHCHYAHDAELASLRKAGTFQKSMLFRYPPPETLGITLSGAASPKVSAVAPGSSAAKAGLQPGDTLLTVNGNPIATTQDMRYALDSVRDTVSITLKRSGMPRSLTFAVAPGWRTYDISDRPSQGGVPPVLGIWEQPLSDTQKKSQRIASEKLALQVSFLFPGEKWKLAQGELRVGDIIVEADGKALPAMTPRQFHTWIRLNKEVGQSVALTIIRNRERKILSVGCIDPGEL